ncbi:MAG TPA: DUF6480 family protein [Mycobacterium sp.]|nr:DUF6480 family protein [Mycobacterium sp.]HTX97495.1 DUF6480 family protein [Mycobacterium sp.]
MTAQPPDPDPAQTPGLEPGGGVAPGSTPPGAPQTAGVAEPQPPNTRTQYPPVHAQRRTHGDGGVHLRGGLHRGGGAVGDEDGGGELRC